MAVTFETRRRGLVPERICRDHQEQEQNMSPASKSVIEITRYLEGSPRRESRSRLDRSVSKSWSTVGAAFNNLINILAILLLSAVLSFLELHIRHSVLHPHPAVTHNTKGSLPGGSLPLHAKSKPVAR